MKQTYYDQIPGPPSGHTLFRGESYDYKLTQLPAEQGIIPEWNCRTNTDCKAYRIEHNIPESVRLTQAQIEAILIEGKHDINVMVNGIAITGQFHNEPELLADKTAFEGARRITTGRILHRKGDERFAVYTAKVYSPKMTLRIARAYNTSKHATDQFLKWNPAEQAQALWTMFYEDEYTEQEIVEITGREITEVRTKIEAASLLLQYQKYTGDLKPGRWDAMYKATSNTQLKSIVKASAKSMQLYFRLIRDNMLGEMSRYMSSVPKVLQNTAAVKILREQGLEQAVEFVQDENETKLVEAIRHAEAVLTFFSGDLTRFKRGTHQWKRMQSLLATLASKIDKGQALGASE